MGVLQFQILKLKEEYKQLVLGPQKQSVEGGGKVGKMVERCNTINYKNSYKQKVVVRGFPLLL